MLRQTKSEVQVNGLAIQRSQEDARQVLNVLGETIRAGQEELMQDFGSQFTSFKHQLLQDIIRIMLESNDRIDPRTGNGK